MADIKLYRSRKQALTLLLASIPFIVAGVWMINTENPDSHEYIMGWLGACFFGLGIPVGLFMLMDRRPQIIITERGIWDRTLKINEIKWEQILDAYAIDSNGKNFIPLVTTPDVKLVKERKWVNWLNKEFGFQKVNLNVANVDVDPDALAIFINQMKGTEPGYRANRVRQFDESLKNKTSNTWTKVIGYTFISTVLLYISLNTMIGLATIMLAAFPSTIILRWYRSTNERQKLQYYARQVLILAALNLFLSFGFIISYKHFVRTTSHKLIGKIENYNRTFGHYPDKIPYKDEVPLNLLEKFIAKEFVYTPEVSRYSLTIKGPMDKTWEYGNYDNEE